MSKLFTKTLLAGAVAAMPVAMSSTAVAQDGFAPADPTSAQEAIQEAPRARDTITVTARQIEETLQDVPGTVNVLSSDVLQSAGVERAEDFINLVPGVTLVNTAEVGDVQVNIRGINGARDAEASFAYVVDGILLTNPSALNREYTNLQQIEIFKGPQGAIYGRNAAAGAIIVTTTMPTNDFEGLAKFSYAEDNTFAGSASVSGPIVEDRLFFRVGGDFRTTDGFYRNSFQDDRKIVDDFDSRGMDARLVFTPSDDVTIDAKFRYSKVEAGAISFNAGFALPALAEAFGVPQLFEDVNDHNFVFQPNIDPQNDQETYEASIKLDWDMEWGTITAWGLFSDVDQSFSADGTSGGFGFFNEESNCIETVAELTPTTPLPPPQFFGGTPGASFLGPYTPSTCDGTQYQERNQQDVSFEIRLTSRSDQALRWQIGGYFLDIDRQVGVNLGIDQQQGVIRELFNPIGTDNPTEALLWDDFDSTVFAVFGQLIYDVTDDIEASVALRYDNENRKARSLVPIDARTQYIVFTPGAPFTGGAPLNPGLDPNINPNLNPDGSIPDREQTFQQVQPKVSLTWDVDEALTLFASWGIGFKSGGFNNAGSAATIDVFINDVSGANVVIEDVFAKETSSAFEVGFKGFAWDDRIQFEGAAFYTDVDDMQFFEFFVGPFGLLRVVNNIDKVELYGAELTMNTSVTDWLTVYAGGTVIESEIKRNTSRPNTVGNKAPYTPDYSINAGFQVYVPITGEINFLGRFDFNYIGPTWFHTVQDDVVPTIQGVPGDYSLTRRDAYHTINIRAGFESDFWSVIFFVDNLTNETFLAEVIPAPEFGGSFLNPGTERRLGIELSARF